jgi:outer membrane protein OmpA-like peptidoglycan-associated protein
MQRLIITVALCIPLLLYSYPTREGVRGLNSIISTSNDGVGHLNFVFDIYGSVGGNRDENLWLTEDFSVGFGFAFTDWLSVNLFSRYMADELDSTGNQNYLSHGLGDLEVGVKITPSSYRRKQNGGWGLGLFPSVSIPIGTEPKDYYPDTIFSFYTGQGGIYRYFTSGEVDYGGKLLISYTTHTDIPVEFDGNIGYFTHNKDTKGNRLSYGFGVGSLYRNFVPYIEVSGSELRDRNMGPRVLYLTPGIKIGNKNGASLNLALNFRVVGHVDKENKKDSSSYISVGEVVTPSWSFNLSYAQGFSFYKQPPSPPTISGIVIDADTREPLCAMIMLPDTLIKTDTMGNYCIQPTPGTFIMRVSCEGYISKEQSVVIELEQEHLISFELEKVRIPMAEIVGKVMDRVSKTPLVAEISFPETDIEPFVTDETGVFKSKLSPGTYIVKTTAEGYIPCATPVLLKDEETVFKDFCLLKQHEKITLRGINFATGSAKIETVYYPILDGGLKILKEYPNIKVEIRGHTDDIGSAEANLVLSQSRARSVMNYFIKMGIEPLRLRAVGYGEVMPIATNGTEEGRAQNRRIEFYILGE